MSLARLISGLLLTIFIFSTSLAATKKSSNSTGKVANEVFFVASRKELGVALKQKDMLRGLAVSVSFYKTTSPTTQKEIDELVRDIISLKLRPIFLYGQPFDQKLANKLLVVGNEVEDGSGCTPTAWAGIFPKKQSAGKMCGADNKPRNEHNFRKWILSYWKDAKDLFIKDK